MSMENVLLEEERERNEALASEYEPTKQLRTVVHRFGGLQVLGVIRELDELTKEQLIDALVTSCRYVVQRVDDKGVPAGSFTTITGGDFNIVVDVEPDADGAFTYGAVRRALERGKAVRRH